MIGILVGMHSEKALLPAGLMVACSGGLPWRARQQAEQMLARGATGLLSFGVAGALGPDLRPGQLVVGSAVATETAVYQSDDRWCVRLARSLPTANRGMVYGGEAVAGTPETKQRLHRRFGGLAVDLESAAAAEACRSAGKPFAVLRAIADPASRSIPSLAMAGLGPDGETRPWAVAAGLMRRPQDLPALIRLGLDTRAALQALRLAVGLVGPDLGFEFL